MVKHRMRNTFLIDSPFILAQETARERLDYVARLHQPKIYESCFFFYLNFVSRTPIVKIEI